MATGPIAEPLSLDVEPGRVYRFVMRIEPIHMAATVGVMNKIVPEVCTRMAIELEAAGAQLEYAAFSRARRQRKETGRTRDGCP